MMRLEQTARRQDAITYDAVLQIQPRLCSAAMLLYTCKNQELVLEYYTNVVCITQHKSGTRIRNIILNDTKTDK